MSSQILILFAITFCFSFCTTKKQIQNSDYLLEKVIIDDKYSGLEKSDIELFIRQKPNRKILKIIPFHTWLYSTINQSKIPIDKEKRNKKFEEINEKRKRKTDNKNNKIDAKNRKIELKNKIREVEGLKPKPYIAFKSPKLKDKSNPTWRESILEAGESPIFLDTFQVKISKEQIKKFLFTKGFFLC